MMDCKAALASIQSWIGEGAPTPDLEDLRAHLGACEDCAESYAALLPLMERDSGNAEALAARDSSACDELAERVMAAIAERAMKTDAASTEPNAGRAASKRLLRFPFGAKTHSRFFRPAIVAAAAAIFALGLGAGIFLTSLRAGEVLVTFALDAPQATSVSLAGDFTGWGSRSIPLRRAASGDTWTASVRLKKDKVYVYNFVVDGKTWIADPTAPAHIDDGFGGSSSLLRL
ncbi:MAG TPA: isoamylase early set domain-containing protein [Rectinemataceae bacterium]